MLIRSFTTFTVSRFRPLARSLARARPIYIRAQNLAAKEIQACSERRLSSCADYDDDDTIGTKTCPAAALLTPAAERGLNAAAAAAAELASCPCHVLELFIYIALRDDVFARAPPSCVNYFAGPR